MTDFGQLQAWAAELVAQDLQSVQRQITEYGSVDIEMMGIGLLEASAIPIVSGTEMHRMGMEMALIFYLQGKVSRCVSAIAAGHMPSDDTLKDIRVYALMLAHVRQFGHWKIEMEESDATGLPRREPD